MIACIFELCTFLMRLSENKFIPIEKLTEYINAFSDHRKYSRFYTGHDVLTRDLVRIQQLMPTDRDFFNRLMSIVSCKDHVLRPTVLKKLQEENAFQGPLNEQFWDNIMKLLTSPEQKVASIQTLLTLKTKETSHTFVQNYDVFFNKLLNLPETTKSEKYKRGLIEIKIFCYKSLHLHTIC